MKIQEILKRINLLNPIRIEIQQEDNIYIICFEVNSYLITLKFNQKNTKKSYCHISYLNHYFFSTQNELRLIFGYLYLILKDDMSKKVLYIEK